MSSKPYIPDETNLCMESTVAEDNNQSKPNDNNNQSGKQHHRRRKKQYYNAIRQQMEFYFSDSNLSKDRFLRKLVEVDPFVPLSTFMKFNKIKELVASIDDIEKALHNSELLKLSCDKQRVRRITDVKNKTDVDEFTVYVEALPPNATHESVRNQFKQFGAVAYVSLPKYRLSGRIKEFAFVEFEDKSSVERCLSAFRQFDGVINGNHHPEKMQSVAAYVKEQEEYEKIGVDSVSDSVMENQISTENEEKCAASVLNSNTANDADNVSTNEQDANLDVESATDVSDVESLPSIASQPPPSKRVKFNQCSIKRNRDPSACDQNKTLSGDDDKADENESNREENEPADFDEEDCDAQRNHRIKRTRRKRRKVKTAMQMPVPNATTDQAANYPPLNNLLDDHPWTVDRPNNSISMLRIATKIDWKRLRNKYLTLQREKYSELKKMLHQQKKEVESSKKISTLPPLPRPVIIKSKSYSSPPPNKQICTRNINFYGAIKDDQTITNIDGNNIESSRLIDTESKINDKDASIDDDKANSQLLKKPNFEFTPGIIVKVGFDAPCVDVTDFKAEMKQYSFVRYVDIKEGATSAFVRVDLPRSAPILIKHCAPNRCQILAGDSETEYWTKISRDREQKLSKAVKTTRNRGRKMRNLLKGASECASIGKGETKTLATHIRFDE